MSNDQPEKKKGLFSGLGKLLGKGEGKSVPEQEPKAPALRPAVQAASKTEESVPPPAPEVPQTAAPSSTPPSSSSSTTTQTPAPKGGRAQHFREEFDVFLSDKSGRKSSKAPTVQSPPVARSGKPQVVKSADLSKEFEFFTKPSRSGGRPQSATPTQGVTAQPPAVAVPAKTSASPVAAPVPVPAAPPVTPAPAPKKEEAALVPPPPPKLEKPAPAAATPAPVQKPVSPAPAPAPAPAPQPVAKALSPAPVTPAPSRPAATVTPVPVEKKAEPAPVVVRKPTATNTSTSPADIFAPRPKATPAAPAPVPAPTPVSKPTVAPVKAPEPVSKPNPVLPPPVVPVAKVEAPVKAPATVVPPPISVPVSTPAPVAKAPEPAPAPAVPVIAVPTSKNPAPEAAPAPIARVSTPSTPAPGSIGSKGIKKVELDPNRRKRPVVVLPPVEEGTAAAPIGSTSSGRSGKKVSPLIWVGALILLLLLIGTGIYIYEVTRETSAEIGLAMDDLAMSRSPLVIYNFDGQVSQIKRDYAERRGPMETRLKEIESDLAAAKADLAGRVEKKRLLTGQIQKLRDSIPVLAGESEKKLDRLWREEGGAIDKAYADQKENLHKEIEKRAKDLGLKYERNKELDALEVAVNAFRLSLYGAPKSVNVDEQRMFSEDLLKRWREFEKEWSKQQLAVKEKAMEIKLSPGPKIQEAEKQIETLKVDLDALNVDLASLQEEVSRRQQDEVEEQEKLREVEKPFLSDLLKIPGNNILREITTEAEGKFVLRNLEKSTDMPPGDYLLFVQGQKGDDIFWAMKPFVITKKKKTTVELSRQDFVPLRKFIQ